jgi:hypothetical protein
VTDHASFDTVQNFGQIEPDVRMQSRVTVRDRTGS